MALGFPQSAVRSDPAASEDPSVPLEKRWLLLLIDLPQSLGYFQVKVKDNDYQHNCSNQQTASDANHNLRSPVEHLSHLAEKFRQQKWLHSQTDTWSLSAPAPPLFPSVRKDINTHPYTLQDVQSDLR